MMDKVNSLTPIHTPLENSIISQSRSQLFFYGTAVVSRLVGVLAACSWPRLLAAVRGWVLEADVPTPTRSVEAQGCMVL